MKHLITLIELTILINLLHVGAQLTKGGGGLSRFKSSIISIQLKQQQVPQIINQNEERTSVKSVVVPAFPIVQTNRQVTEEVVSNEDNSQAIYGQVDGVPGIDFPGFTTIPNTKFSCEGVPFEPGMYADESTGCQVYHLCYQGRRESFLCGIGTVFNQAIMNCDFWHSVDCSKSSQFYQLNAEFGKGSTEPSSPQKAVQTISSVNVNRVVIPSTKTSSSFSEQRFSSNAILPPTIGAIKERVSSVVQSSGSTIPVGKTSIFKQSNAFGNILSPSQRIRITEGSELEPPFVNQLALETSNSLKVATKTQGPTKMNIQGNTNSAFSTGTKSSLEVSKTNPRDKLPRDPAVKEEISPANPNELVEKPETNVVWKPYSKKRQTTTVPPISSTPPPISTFIPSTVASADKEPTFSADKSPELEISPEQPKIPISAPPGTTTSLRTPETQITTVNPTTTTGSPTPETSIESPSLPVTESPVVVETSTSLPSVSTSERQKEQSQPTTITTSPDETTEPQPVVRSIKESSVVYAKQV